jgi:hypothetical protein
VFSSIPQIQGIPLKNETEYYSAENSSVERVNIFCTGDKDLYTCRGTIYYLSVVI